MDSQFSFIDSATDFPTSHQAVIDLYNKYIRSEDEDEVSALDNSHDVFFWNNTTNGISYYIYKVKVFAMSFGIKKKLQLTGEGMTAIGIPKEKKENWYTLSVFEDINLDLFITYLRQRKEAIKEEQNRDTFGCCNDFIRCSDQKKCIHEKDNFYQGCIYRKNLENGRIFYGINKNYPINDVHISIDEDTEPCITKLDLSDEDIEFSFTSILAIDFETASSHKPMPVCSLGLWKINILDGTVIDKQYILINPEHEFDSRNTLIHGITENDIKDKPTFPVALRFMEDMIDEDTIVIAHNIKCAELTYLRYNCQRYEVSCKPFYFYDTQLFGQMLKNKGLTPDYKLTTIADYCHIDFGQHHNSLDDAHVCCEIFRYFIKPHNLFSSKKIEAEYGITAGYFDGDNSIGNYIAVHSNSINRSAEEKQNQIIITDTIRNMFKDKVVVITGTPSPQLSQHKAEDILNYIGSIVDRSVTKKRTQILISGSQDLNKLNGNEKSKNLQNAERYNCNGASIQIISGLDFTNMLTNPDNSTDPTAEEY